MSKLRLQTGTDIPTATSMECSSVGLSLTPWTLSPATGKMPRRCPSPLLYTLREGWLPPGLSPLSEAWVAAGRTGWMLPLPLGVEVGTWRAPCVVDATATHTCSLCHLLPARPPLPTLALLPWMSLPSPGTRLRGTPMRKTSRRSGEAQTWAHASSAPGGGGLGEEPGASAKVAPGLLEPQNWLGWAGSSTLECRSFLRRDSRTRAVLSHQLGFLGCLVRLRALVSLSVKGVRKQFVCLR